MELWEWVRFVAGTGFLLCGLLIFLVEIYGIFHLDYALNRMHAAAMGDTLGISFSLVGLMIFSGFHFTTLKIALIIIFFWFASPVSSHLLSRLEATTNENLREHCRVYSDLAVLEKELQEEKAAKEHIGKEDAEGRRS